MVCSRPRSANRRLRRKIELLHLMDALGIDTADIGLPGAGGTHAAGVEMMAREIADKKLRIRPNCAARTHRNDIIPILEISQRAGIANRSLHLHRIVTDSFLCRRVDAG